MPASQLKPAVLTVTVVAGPPSCRLNWTQKGSPPSEYRVHRNGTLITTLSGSTLTYTDTNVVAGTTYSYYLRSYRPVGTIQSNTVTVTVPAAIIPTAAPVLTGTAGATQVSLTWTSVPNADSYTLQRKIGAGTYGDLISQAGLSYVNTGLTNGTSYTYRVKGTSASGANSGPWSNEVAKTPTASVPVAPTLTGTAGDSENTLDWNSVVNASTYRLRRQIGADPMTSFPDTTATDYIDDTVTNNTLYQYTVRGIAADGTLGSISAPVNLTPTAANPSPNPSGEAMPTANPAGWTRIFEDDFNINVPLGSFPGPVADKWWVYPATWPDTSGRGMYSPQIISIANSMMDIYIHTENGTHMVAAPLPNILGPGGWPGLNRDQLYGRYTIRFRADAIPGYKMAWLLWPLSETWPRDGEIDFPEGELTGTIFAAMHRQDGTWVGDQDVFYTSATFPTWHTAITEWSPNLVKFYLDGALIGTSTWRIPNTKMHWVIQNETNLSGYAIPDTAAGHVQIDWVVVWSYTP